MKLLMLLSATILTFASCSKKEPEKEPEQPKSETCDLLTFTLPKAGNGLTSDLKFRVSNKGQVTAKYLVWIDGEKPDMMIPEFTTNGVSVSVDGEKIVSGETPLSFASPFTLTVTAENGDKKEYTVDLNCPQINTELPVLRLDIAASAITSKDVYTQINAELYSPHTTEGWWKTTSPETKIEIRGRGNSTWILPKKPYRLKFPEKVSPVGLKHCSAKSWVLLANDMDKSLIRDALGWAMSRILFNPKENYHDALAVMFTPSAQFVNVYMMGPAGRPEYHGLYLMSDQMEYAKGRIEVDKLEAKDGSDAEKIKGGHILEVNIHSEPAPIRFRTGTRRIQVDHKYPKDDDYDPAQYTFIEQHIAKAEQALYSSTFTNPTTGWRKYFDEKTLADYIIVKELCGDMDGYTSTYFYKRRGSDKLFFGPIWDVDKGWDNDKRNPQNVDKSASLMIKAGFQMPGANGSDWFNRFWEDASFRSFVNNRWKEKRAELVNTVKALADELSGSMSKSIEANFTKWQFYYQASTEANMPAATYADEISRIKRLTDARAAALDAAFAK